MTGVDRLTPPQKLEFRFKGEDGINVDQQEINAKEAEEADNDEDSSPTVLLSKEASRLGAKYRDESEEDDKKWSLTIRPPEHDLRTLVVALTRTCTHVLDNPVDQPGEKQLSPYLKDLNIQLSAAIDKSIRLLKVSLKSLVPFANFAIRIFHEKVFLFSDYFDTILDTERLAPEESDALFRHIFDGANIDLKELQKSLDSLQSVATVLLDPASKRSLFRNTSSAISGALKIPLGNLGIPEAELKRLLPENLKCTHCCSYLRELHKTCGKIQFIMVTCSTKTGEKSEVYKELIPAEFNFEAFREEDNAFEFVDADETGEY